MRTIKDVWQLSDKELDEEWRDLTDYLIVENQDSELAEDRLAAVCAEIKRRRSTINELTKEPRP